MRGGRVKDAKRFWVEAISQLGVKTPTIVWATVIEGFTALKMFTRVRTAWNAFSSTKAALGPAAAVYRAYVSALFDEDRGKDALTVFESFHKQLHKESGSIEGLAVVSVYNVALEWLVRQSCVSEARKILDRMKTSGPKPDTGSFNVFIQHASCAKDLKMIADILREIRSIDLTGDLYTASVPLIALYPVRTDSTELIIALLRDSGTVLDIQAYNTLLDRLARSASDDAIATAVQLLDYMEAQTSRTSRPNELSYIGVLCGIERHMWNDPSLTARFRGVVIGKMKDHSRKLTRSITTLNVIQAYLQHPGSEGVQKAMAYYDRYKQVRTGKKIYVNVWCTLLCHRSRRQEWENADALASEILVRERHISNGLAASLDRVRQRISELDFNETF